MSESPSPPDWPARLGNAGVLLLLAALAWLAAGLQSRELAWTDPGLQRWLAAATAVVAYVAFCTMIHWRQRRRQRAPAFAATGSDAILVAYASQTGMAEDLARRTAAALSEAGRGVRLLAINRVDAQVLRDSSQALFVVSTYGEGDPPDMAAGFARRVLGKDQALASLRYAVLALGDSSYAQFCGFGRRLDAWLRHQGAQSLFDRIEVDNAEPGALRHWQHQVGVLAGRSDQADWSTPHYARWRLQARAQLNPGSAGGACFHLALVPEDGTELAWQAGDVAEIGPRHSAEAVRQWLQRQGLDGNAVVADGEPLAAFLARHQWPQPAQLEGRSVAQWAAQLKPLPHREYSIASIPADGRLELLVRQWRSEDGSLGLGSGWLTAVAADGAGIDLRLRTNSHFHMPAGPCPLILIGNGTGLAGLRALLKARIAAGQRRNWLLFGERNRRSDYFFEAEIEGWRESGWLERVDLVFSRDQAEKIYVQQRVGEAAGALAEWVAAGACIYVCGSLQGMAPAVDAQLRAALGAEVLEQLAEQGRYRRDVY